MEWWPVRVDELTDARVRGLTDAQWRVWMLLRAAAAAGESGGVVLVADGRRGEGRRALHPSLRAPWEALTGARRLSWRTVSALVDSGLLVSVGGSDGHLEFCDADAWRSRATRVAKGREQAAARRAKAPDGRGESATSVARRDGGYARGERVERETVGISLSTTSPTASTITPGDATAPVRIRTAAHLQRPAGDDDIRPAVREAITAARNIGGDDGKRLLADTLADLHPLTTAEHDATSSQE